MADKKLARPTAVVGAADHCGWMVLVTVLSDGTVIDRRRVELVDADLPKLPHHHDCQGLPMNEAVALIKRVRRSADVHSKRCVDALIREVPAEIAGIAMRACLPLPETIEERITNYRAQNAADSVMFREALREAAEASGWFVNWYEAKHVFAEAAKAMRRKTIDDLIDKAGEKLGPSWQRDHRVAMAAAIAANPLHRNPKRTA